MLLLSLFTNNIRCCRFDEGLLLLKDLEAAVFYAGQFFSINAAIACVMLKSLIYTPQIVVF